MAFVHPEYLVSTGWLAEHFDDPDVRVLDVTAKLTSKLENRAEEECYLHSHIPGSLFFDVASGRGVLSDEESSLPWMWPAEGQFSAVLEAVGVGPGTRVVLVARTPREGIDSGTMWCTRAWWTMHHYGVDCSILHGGLERWEAEGRPIASGIEVVPRVEPFEPSSHWHTARATRDDVLEAVTEQESGTGATCLVDALPSDSFDGTGQTYGPRAGHISGAVNVPFRSLIVGETADFVDADSMQASLTTAGLMEAPRVITYCGGAIAATVDAFCLALLGHDDVAVYDGSLMEWSADPELPMTDPSS